MFFSDIASADSAQKLAETLDFSALQKQADEAQAEISLKDMLFSLLRGEEASVGWREILRDAVGAESLLASGLMIAAPGCIGCVCAALLEEKGARLAARFCAITQAVICSAIFFRCAKLTAELASRVGSLCEGAAPVLAALLSASGGISGAAMLTPAAAFAAQMASRFIGDLTIPAISCAGAIASCSAFSKRFSFSALQKMLIGLCNWAHAALTGVLLCVLSARGLLTGGADSISMHTARYTVDSLLPVVGGDIADSLSLLVASAQMVTGALGVTCAILLILIAARPVCVTCAYYVLLKLISAALEPLGAEECSAVLEAFARAFRALLVACACAAMLFVLLLGAATAMGRGIFA